MLDVFTDTNSKLGSELCLEDKLEALNRFTGRFTGDHVPYWVEGGMPNGKPYVVQFKDDQDWLANTRFHVTEEGRLRVAGKVCCSIPTWPNGKPEGTL